MKLDKPERIQIAANIDLRGTGGFTTTAAALAQACKQLDKPDYVTLDGFYCYPVATLKNIVKSYQRDSLVHVHPVTAWQTTINEVFEPDPSAPWKKRFTGYSKEYTPVYNALELREQWQAYHSPEASKQILYPARLDNLPKPGHVATLTTEAVTARKPDPWIIKAISKDDARPGLMVDGGNFGVDGTRLHYDPRLPELPHNYRDSCNKEFLVPGRKNKNIVTLDQRAALDLITACKLAKKGKHFLRMSVNGALELTILDDRDEDECATTTRTITAGYSHSGPDVMLAINPAFLMDALDKPTATTIKINDASHPVYITDGTREAIIMPMHIDNPEPERSAEPY